jgi:hypothetical protein
LAGGRAVITVFLDGEQAAWVEVPEEHHCAEILALLWPELTLQDRAEIARGGSVSNSVPPKLRPPAR